MKTFKSGTEFAAFLMGLRPSAELATAAGMRDAGRLLQGEARDVLGRYQAAVGPIPAWAPLSERTRLEREKRGLAADNPLLATHELKAHIDLEHTARQAVVGVPFETVGDGSKQNPARNIGVVAITMEQGTARVPARPFLARAGFTQGHNAAGVVLRSVGDALASVPHVTVLPEHDAIPF